MTEPASGGSTTEGLIHEAADEAPLRRVSLDGYEPGAGLLRALSSPVRLALVDLLNNGPRCVHELVDALAIPQPLVSQHLKTLRSAGVVRTRRRGREVVYSLVDHHIAHVAADAITHAAEPAPRP